MVLFLSSRSSTCCKFNLIKMKTEQNAVLNIGNILAEEIILTKIHIMDADKGPSVLQCVKLNKALLESNKAF